MAEENNDKEIQREVDEYLYNYHQEIKGKKCQFSYKI